MIDEEETFKCFGYYSTDLKPKSGKKIIVVCDNCGKVRIIRKADYRDLCHFCSMQTEDRRKKISDIATKRWEDPEMRKKMCECLTKTLKTPEEQKKRSKRMIKRYEDPEERKKQSERTTKRWNDPGAHKKQSKTHSGENNPNWLGGISFGPYCPKFNGTKKSEIRDKYNNCDYISGLPCGICNNSRKLDVHHVNYNKQQGCEDHEWRLIPLSRSNHIKTNNNRSFWNRLFTYSLRYDEKYYKEEDEDFDIFLSLKKKNKVQ